MHSPTQLALMYSLTVTRSCAAGSNCELLALSNRISDSINRDSGANFSSSSLVNPPEAQTSHTRSISSMRRLYACLTGSMLIRARLADVRFCIAQRRASKTMAKRSRVICLLIQWLLKSFRGGKPCKQKLSKISFDSFRVKFRLNR